PGTRRVGRLGARPSQQPRAAAKVYFYPDHTKGVALLEVSAWMWVAFNGLVLAMLALDLGVFNRNAHAIKAKEAAIWTVVWIAIAVIFGGFLYWWKGADIAMQYFAGYLIEKSLSADNIFVFVLIFTYFAVPAPKGRRYGPPHWGHRAGTGCRPSQ